ncbi:hypothetical protein [Bacteroides caccae]|nr:hypothetical protein [Bacteroides caccae]
MNPTSKGCWLMATAPPTDRRQSDFLEGAQFAVCLIIATAMAHSKKKKERLTDEASMFSFVCKPFPLFLLISRQSLVSVAGCPKCVWLAVARFSGGIRSKLFEEDSARNGSAARPCQCRQSHTPPLHPSIGDRWLTG